MVDIINEQHLVNLVYIKVYYIDLSNGPMINVISTFAWATVDFYKIIVLENFAIFTQYYQNKRDLP